MSNKINEVELDDPCKICGGKQVKEIYDSGGVIIFCTKCETI